MPIFCAGGNPQRISSSERSPSLALQTTGRELVRENAGERWEVSRAVVLDLEQNKHRLLRLGHGVEVAHVPCSSLPTAVNWRQRMLRECFSTGLRTASKPRRGPVPGQSGPGSWLRSPDRG